MKSIIRRRKIKMLGQLSLNNNAVSSIEKSLFFTGDKGYRLKVSPDYINKKLFNFINIPLEVRGVIEYKDKSPQIKIENFVIKRELLKVS